jgi:hypothetical protein
MTTKERSQALALNSEIPNSITEGDSKDCERNNNENDKLLCERDKELDPHGLGPGGRKMGVNPLRSADQIDG